MLSVSTFKFAIDENIIWNIISNIEQEFSNKKAVHLASV